MLLQTIKCECSLININYCCYAEWILMHFSIWLFFSWNFKVDIINWNNTDLTSIHHIDHVICALFETSDAFFFKLKWNAMRYCFVSHACNLMPLLLFSHILFTGVRACVCHFVSQTMTEILHVQLYLVISW